MEAHHPDHRYWWRVAWLCFSCHRQVEFGTVTLRDRDVCDYWTLLLPVMNRKLWVPIQAASGLAPWQQQEDEAAGASPDDTVPF